MPGKTLSVNATTERAILCPLCPILAGGWGRRRSPGDVHENIDLAQRGLHGNASVHGGMIAEIKRNRQSFRA